MAEPALNLERFLENFGDLGEGMHQIIRSFLAGYPLSLDRIARAIADHDAVELLASAHALKGSAAQMFAEPATQLASRIEKIGSSGTTEGALAILGELTAELARLRTGLEGVARDDSLSKPQD